MTVGLLFPVLSLHTKPSPHILYIEALLLLFRNHPLGLYRVTRIIMGFHYAANGAKVGPIHRNIYRQVSNYIKIILDNLVQ